MRSVIRLSLILPIIFQFSFSDPINQPECVGLSIDDPSVQEWLGYWQLQFDEAIRTEKKIFIDEFMGTGCPYCTSASFALNVFLEEYGYGEGIVFCQWHNPYYGPELAIDTYYQRAGFYGVGGIPHVRFNGTISQVGAYHFNYWENTIALYQPLILSQTGLETPYDIGIQTEVNGDTVFYEIEISLEEDHPADYIDILAFLTEDHLLVYWPTAGQYENARGVVRDWIHTEDISIATGGESEIFSGSVVLEDDWNIQELGIAVCLQDMSSQAIHQSQYAPLNLSNLLIMDAQIQALVNDSDGDGVMNPGETFDLLVAVENLSDTLNALNVTGLLTTDALLTIENNVVSFGDMMDEDPPVEQAFTLTLDPDIPLGSVLLNLLIAADYIDLNGNPQTYITNFPIQFEVSLFQSGWPVSQENQVESSALVMDWFPEIPGQELVLGGYDGFVRIFDAAGNEIVNSLFPFDTDEAIRSSPAAADIDLDGITELVITSGSRHLYILEPQTETVQLIFFANQILTATPALGNIDDDGELEIVFGGYSEEGRLWAINSDGTDVVGFPIVVDEPILRGAALNDFDGNGKVDIVVATEDNHVWLFNDDGSTAAGFPFTSQGAFTSAPTVVVQDGESLILAGCQDYYLYGIYPDGSQRFARYHNYLLNTSPSVHMIGEEVFLFYGTEDWRVYAVDLDGNNHDGWPVVVGADVNTSAAIADLDGDHLPEIVLGSDTGVGLVFNLDGSYFPYFPLGYSEPLIGSPAIHDLDGDGDQEIIFGAEASIPILDIKNTGSTAGYWNCYRANARRTGTWITVEMLSIGDINQDTQIDVLDIVVLVSIILGDEIPTSDQEILGDMNEDGILNVLDVVIIVDVILNNI